ncbi:MAG TPA: thiamine pyrophosphate-dependent enzyme, partial [Gemmataceae bacterium]|nr:thiamine pyrophosphate-dependent enzyme [Gemmataceae bacterium]
MTSQPIQQALAPERLAVVNIDMGEVLRIVTPKVFVEADAGIVFTRLNQLCDGTKFVPPAPTPMPVAHYMPQLAADLPQDADIEPPRNHLHGSLLQSEALAILQQFLPTSGHLLFDAGNCAAAALHYLRVPRTVSTTIALGMGGMGYAIAGAIGAQLGSPCGSRTMVFCGDGAFLMLGTEVNTAVHYRLPILFVVFNNGMHGMCVTRQQLYFDGRIEGSRYPAVSVADMARGLGSPDGLWVGSAGSSDGLSEQLADYLRADRPGVLELRLSREEVPPFSPFLPADAPIYQDIPLASA